MTRLFLVFLISIPVLTGLVFLQVTEEWVARYDGPANNGDHASAMAIDESGNVYVTGNSFASGTMHDYTTIKYDANGDTVWVRRYNGPENNQDYPYAIAVDNAGNVYVTGQIADTVTASACVTVKYNSVGEGQWLARYIGTHLGSNDDPRAIAVDDSGNVYVTLQSLFWGTGYDYTTIKYDSNGDSVWVRRYNGPTNGNDYAKAMALDDAGNVYVTGYSYYGYSTRYATVKYNTSGVQQWVAEYNGPADAYDYATAIAIDTSGNVYVTGNSRGLGTDDDYATIKYDSNGDSVWVARYNGPENFYDHALAIAVDNAGNVYVTGFSYSSVNDRDYVTIMYDSDGDTVWVRRYNGPYNNEDNARAIAIDNSGNVYVTGESYGAGPGVDWDFATIKYSSTGVEEWVVRYDGPAHGEDKAVSIAVDGSGNVYVMGSSKGDGTSDDFTTIKYSQTAGIETTSQIIPDKFILLQNFPNPFNASTMIRFGLPTAADVEIAIYNILGQKVATLVSAKQPPGKYEVQWDASGMASGVYLYQLKASEYVKTRKLVYMK